MDGRHARKIGLNRAPDGRFARVVDKMVLHEEPLEFRELCRRTIPPETRYLILDLDRTIHLGRNMGELLGWEICAYLAYGQEYLESLRGQRPPGRFLLDRNQPFSMLRYLFVGVRLWAVPGLYYLFWGKIASRLSTLRRWTFLRFGPEPVRVVQRVPQTALMHHMSRVPLALLRTLAEDVWQRHGCDQTIEKEDIRWLRERCPGIKIIITSASPQPMLEVARDMLEVDDVIYSSQEEFEGYLSAPHRMLGLTSRRNVPRRISPLSAQFLNVSYDKIDALIERYPDLLEPEALAVGISDTGYGEDHCWAQYLDRVIDINSSAPFSPVVAVDSPVQEIHSASVLTRGEKERRAGGDEAYLDARRKTVRAGSGRTYNASELEYLLGDVLERIESTADLIHNQSQRLSGPLEKLGELFRGLEESLEMTVHEYNDASGRSRRKYMNILRKQLRKSGDVLASIAEQSRPLSELSFVLIRLLERSRESLGSLDPADSSS